MNSDDSREARETPRTGEIEADSDTRQQLINCHIALRRGMKDNKWGQLSFWGSWKGNDGSLKNKRKIVTARATRKLDSEEKWKGYESGRIISAFITCCCIRSSPSIGHHRLQLWQ